MIVPYNEFITLIRKYVDVGTTPVLACCCGQKMWAYEGSIAYLYEEYLKPCRHCQKVNEKLIFGDFTAEL
jgi:hypothetical protein